MSTVCKYAFATATGGGGGGGAVDPDMVRAVTLTGLDKTVGVVTAADSILSGMGKLAANTEALQGSIGGKQDTITGAATTVVALDLAVNRAVLSNNSGKLAVSAVTSTELGYLANATSEIQAQLNAKQASINQGLNTGDSPTFVGVTLSGLTANQLVSTDALTKNLISLPTATYPSLTEISYVKGVTSAIQTQFGGKQNNLTGAATSIATADLAVDRVLTSNALGKVDVSATTATELSYLSGVTSAIQSQINSKQATVTGAATTIVTADLTASRLLQSNALGKVAVLDTATYPSLTEISYVKGVTSAIQTQLNTLSGNGFTKYATIAAAEAATATEGTIAYVVDKIGFYEYCTTCSQTVDHDLVLSTGAAGTTRWVKVQTVKRGVGDVGWVDTDGATISTTSATNVRLTIASTAIYAIKGLRVELPAGDYDCTLSGVAGVKFIYFDDTSKVLKFQDTVFDFAHHCPVSVAYWSGTAIVAAPQTEFHGIRDIAWHKWAHNNLGTQYKEGLLFTGSVQTDNTTTPADATVSYLWSTTGKIVDEDVESNPGVGQWLQTLGSGLTSTTAAIFNFFYYNGSFVTTNAAMADRTPFIHGGGTTFPYYESAGVLTEASDNRYIVYHYFATPMTGGWSVFARPHNAQYTSLALATAARPNQLTWSNYAELKHIYTAIFRTRTQFTNVPHRCKLVSLQDFRLVAGSPVAGISATDHQALSNRTALNSHPVGAISGITGGSIPFVDTTTLALNEDSGLSWDNTGKTLSATTLSTDTISEKTATAGVTIDTVLLKDGSAQNTGFYGAEPGAVSTSTSGQAGTAVTASRSDHNHDLGTHAHVDATNGGQVSHASLSNLHQDVATTASPSFVSVTATTSLLTDTVSERTAAAGVTIDGVLIKDGLVDGQDISARINQDVKTTSTPTFAGIITAGNVDGVDVSAFKTDYDAKVNQDVRTTALPTFTRGSVITQTFNPAAAQDIQSAQKRTGLRLGGASQRAESFTSSNFNFGANDISLMFTVSTDVSAPSAARLIGFVSALVQIQQKSGSLELQIFQYGKTLRNTGLFLVKGQAHTVIFTRSNNNIRLYLDGKVSADFPETPTVSQATPYLSVGYNDSTEYFLGSANRAGLFNYALPEDKIRRYSAGERLDFEDIGGSMSTAVTTTDVNSIVAGGTESSVADGGLGRNVYQIVATATLVYCYVPSSVIGKRYRMKFKAKGIAGGVGKSFVQNIADQADFVSVLNPVLTSDWQDYILELTALTVTGILLKLSSTANGDGFQLDSFSYDVLGALAAYEGENLLPSAATWPDSSGNNNDLTITGATVINSQDSLEIKDRLIVTGSTLLKTSSAGARVTARIENTSTSANSNVGLELATANGLWTVVADRTAGVWAVKDPNSIYGLKVYPGSGLTQGIVSVPYTTPSTSSTDGALVVSGGVGIGGALNVGGYTQLGGSSAPKMAIITTAGTAITIPAGAAPQSATYTVTGIAGARIKNVIGRVLPQGSTSYRSIPCSSDMGIASYTIDWSTSASSIITVTRSSAYETGLSAAVQLYIMYEVS